MEDIVKIETPRREFNDWFQSVVKWARENQDVVTEEFVDQKIQELKRTYGGWEPPKLGELHQCIITVLLRTDDRRRGLHIIEIYLQCHHISSMSWSYIAMEKEIENLQIWGLIYTTISEGHWATVVENENQLQAMSVTPEDMLKQIFHVLLGKFQPGSNPYTIEGVRSFLPRKYSLIDAVEIRRNLRRSHVEPSALLQFGLDDKW
jgi:hypothetical protein